MKLALYVCLKNICDGVGGQDESNGTPLDPPLFWLDNIFKESKYLPINYRNQNFVLMPSSANTYIEYQKGVGPITTSALIFQ
jgi:hypothetical protein